MTELKPHPLAEYMPPMSDEDFGALKASIQSVGLIDPIILYEGKILDGRHRYRACIETGSPVRTETYDDANMPAWSFVAAKSLRRDTSASQRAIIALNFLPHFEARAKERQRTAGGNKKSVSQKSSEPIGKGQKAVDECAAVCRVNSDYIAIAHRIQRHKPGLIAKIMAGDMTISQAVKVIPKPPKPQKTPADKAGKSSIPEPPPLAKITIALPPTIIESVDAAIAKRGEEGYTRERFTIDAVESRIERLAGGRVSYAEWARDNPMTLMSPTKKCSKRWKSDSRKKAAKKTASKKAGK